MEVQTLHLIEVFSYRDELYSLSETGFGMLAHLR